MGRVVDIITGEETITVDPIENQSDLDLARAEMIRFTRDQKLVDEVDPIAGNALRWAALSAEEQAAWAAYRQALLDVPAQYGFPNDVTWPTKPE